MMQQVKKLLFLKIIQESVFYVTVGGRVGPFLLSSQQCSMVIPKRSSESQFPILTHYPSLRQLQLQPTHFSIS